MFLINFNHWNLQVNITHKNNLQFQTPKYRTKLELGMYGTQRHREETLKKKITYRQDIILYIYVSLRMVIAFLHVRYQVN